MLKLLLEGRWLVILKRKFHPMRIQMKEIFLMLLQIFKLGLKDTKFEKKMKEHKRQAKFLLKNVMLWKIGSIIPVGKKGRNSYCWQTCPQHFSLYLFTGSKDVTLSDGLLDFVWHLFIEYMTFVRVFQEHLITVSLYLTPRSMIQRYAGLS